MNILGLGSWFHDSSACLMVDGDVVAYAEEERFNRIKHTHNYPHDAVEWTLKTAGLTLDDLDEVVFYLNPVQYLVVGFRAVIASFPYSLALLGKNAATTPPLFRLRHMVFLKKFMCREHGARGDFKTVFLDHYRTHQGSTFFASGFDEAAILTMDFAGDGRTEVIAHGRGLNISDLLTHRVPVGFGMIYSTITQLLGFKWWDEFKIMGMAAYGEPRFLEQVETLYSFDSETGDLTFNLEFFDFHKYGRNKLYSEKIHDIFGPARDPQMPITQREYDLAASLQAATNAFGLSMAGLAKKLTGSSNLCLAGGVAQNCLMNQAICDSGLFENVFLQPLSGDFGCSLGGALYQYHRVHRQPRKYIMNHLFLGPSFEGTSESVAGSHGLVQRPNENWCADVAKAIAEGLVVGFFDGRMEVGPRALGSRSILADPRRHDMKDILNSRVKHREHFRPFAPSVLASEVNTVFEPLPACRTLDYMIVTMTVRPEWRQKVPAITHEDYTARVQTVRLENSPNFYEIIRAFHEITGIPLVINTSFNDNEPIVCTPQHAIDCFFRTQIDLLVLDGRLYYREDNLESINRSSSA